MFFFKIVMLFLFGVVATKAVSLNEITASDGALVNEFGYSVSISGTTAIVGAFAKNIGSNTYQGAAYIFSCPTPSNCTQASELLASDGASGAFFGSSVTISGTTAIVGAFASNTYQGATYIFSCPTPSNCTQASKLVASDGASQDQFGYSVSISGTTAIVGATGKNNSQGAAYIFSCPTPSNCTQTSELVVSDGEQFGTSVIISGTTVIVGNPGKTNSTQGAAYIFTCPTPSNCTQASKLLASDGTLGDAFGYSISISGTTVIVGAPGKNTDQGAAYIFTCPTPSNCIQTSELLASDGASGAFFGFSASIFGITAIVSAPGRTIDPNSYQGAVYIFTCPTPSNCTQTSEILGSINTEDDYFGYSVSISGTTAIVGAPIKTISSNIAQGAAYVVDLSTPTPTSAVFTGPLVSFNGSTTAVNPSEVKTCRIVESFGLATGYSLTANESPLCCTQIGLVSGSECEISTCGIIIANSSNYATSDSFVCFADIVCYTQGADNATDDAIPVYNGTAFSGTYSLTASGPQQTSVFIQKPSGAVSAAFQITPGTKKRNNARKRSLASEYGCSVKGSYSDDSGGSCSHTLCGTTYPISDYFHDGNGNCYGNCIGST